MLHYPPTYLYYTTRKELELDIDMGVKAGWGGEERRKDQTNYNKTIKKIDECEGKGSEGKRGGEGVQSVMIIIIKMGKIYVICMYR